MYPLTLFQYSIIDRLEGGDIARNSDESSRSGTPNTPSNSSPSSDLNDEINTFPAIQFPSFLIPSVNFGIVDSLYSIDLFIPDEWFEQFVCPIQLGLR